MEDNERFAGDFDHLIGLEGKYSNDPADPGGETRYGISIRWHPEAKIFDLPEEEQEDEARRFYLEEYWTPHYSTIIDEDVRREVFEFAVHKNPRAANSLLQVAVFKSGGSNLKIDGILGPRSIDAINNHPDMALLHCKLQLLIINYYYGTNPKQLRGFIGRVLK